MNLSSTDSKKSNLIKRLAGLKQTANADWWDKISESEKASIKKGVADVKAGRLTPHSKVQLLYAKWL